MTAGDEVRAMTHNRTSLNAKLRIWKHLLKKRVVPRLCMGFHQVLYWRLKRLVCLETKFKGLHCMNPPLRSETTLERKRSLTLTRLTNYFPRIDGAML